MPPSGSSAGLRRPRSETLPRRGGSGSYTRRIRRRCSGSPWRRPTGPGPVRRMSRVPTEGHFAVERLAAELSEAAGAPVELERPREATHGDYATNVALRLAP